MYIYNRQLKVNEARRREGYNIARPSSASYYPVRRPLQHCFHHRWG